MECFGGSQAKAGFANSNQKDQVLVSSVGSYLRDAQGKELGGRRDCLSPGALGKLYQEHTLTCDSAGSYLVHGLLSRART